MAARKPSKPAGPVAPVEALDAIDAIDTDKIDGAVDTVSEAADPVPHAVVDAGRAQALSMAMVDAAGHLRRLETLSLACIAVALEHILAGDGEQGAAALQATESSLDKAIGRLAELVRLSDT